jgi:abortive infection bacteriophage resistance protein
MRHAKQALKIEQLYQKLCDRSLGNTDEDKRAIFNALERVGYFRLTGYCLPFLQKTAANKKVFRKGTTIHDVLALYEFDTKLRSLALQALEKIEIALAASICNTLCIAYSPLWYSQEEIFVSPEAYAKTFDEATKYLKFDVTNQRGFPKNPNLFLKHYYDKYTDPRLPPAWMLRECTSFGFWSHTFSGIKQGSKSDIAALWKYPNRKPLQPTVFESWLHTLSVFRNRCAHHNRITNVTLPFSPKVPDNAPAASRFHEQRTDDLRTVFLLLDLLLRSAAPDFGWKSMLKDLFNNYSPRVAVAKATGFEENWAEDVFWSDWTPPATAKVAAAA